MAKKLTPAEIVEKANALYRDLDGIYSLSGARNAAKMAAYLLAHLAANLVPEEEARKIAAPKAPVAKKAKKPKKDNIDDWEF